MIAAKEYRFLSPVFPSPGICHPRDTHEIMGLKGASLVHSPNFALTALNSQEAHMPPTPMPSDDPAKLQGLMDAIITYFGLPADTTPDQVMTALKSVADKAAPDPAKYMPVEAVQSMMADRRNELVSVAEGRAQQKVNAAFRQGYIHGGMRDWALSLCRSDEAAFDTCLD